MAVRYWATEPDQILMCFSLRSSFNIAVIILALTIWAVPSFARMTFVTVTEPISQADKEKYGYIPEIEHAKPKIYKYESFSIIRLEGQTFCDKRKCITYLVQNCAKSVCPYATAMAGPVFAGADVFIRDGSVYDRYAEFLSFCDNPLEARVVARFLIGRRLITLRPVSDIDCN